jgi:hypothetical protein
VLELGIKKTNLERRQRAELEETWGEVGSGEGKRFGGEREQLRVSSSRNFLT